MKKHRRACNRYIIPITMATTSGTQRPGTCRCSEFLDLWNRLKIFVTTMEIVLDDSLVASLGLRRPNFEWRTCPRHARAETSLPRLRLEELLQTSQLELPVAGRRFLDGRRGEANQGDEVSPGPALSPFASAAVLYANAIVRIPSPRDMGSSAGTTTQRTCDRRCRRSESPSKSSA